MTTVHGGETDEDFFRLADPYRRELFTHCYRMLGSVQDAEDLVQETFLRAWRAYERFQHLSSLRTWLYRIATRACLTALHTRARRPLPVDLGGPAADFADPGPARHDVPWLQPVPDAAVPGGPDDPAGIVTARESIRLAFVAALQHLPPRPRAVLILRDVMGWRAAEVADVLDTTPTAVHSSLRRARAQLEEVSPRRDRTVEPPAAEQRELLDRYVTAFENHDVTTLVELFTADTTWQMPPQPTWYRGAATIAGHLATWCAGGPGDVRLVPTRANGQPAFATYRRATPGDRHRITCLQVLTLTSTHITQVVTFADPALCASFGLPETLPA
ncbi:sigma-70 family RNA polymerase sigma factor [Actinosynnema sp. NPDC047251]|uniref:RNA polymerase sigma factor n=1 Tax=Saccharothrix espanaensis (strain ATCC 51144 / DSM 44229 / JCM 9112 / NBRC 15066 / NRRL 15764) TaxID=1179773 RepID=K0K2U5_SACES|nr:sigma-70 family RNA polymerase sigma factor [Saccharothrix espanaensis]CCH31189.1 RNA polymerase factor sigma-70 [Saccharothrix espanaensis DSM 44229]